jgi:Ala-tRNA(Pro) deacylase
MSCTEEQLFSFLDNLGIPHETTRHPPFFTVEEGREWHNKIPGLHCKNLFLKDKKGIFWLVVMAADKRADLAGIAMRIGAGKMSFASEALLLEVLGLTPGSVTPFALMNDTQKRVRIVLDKDLVENKLINVHPMHNAASTTLRSADLIKFIQNIGHDFIVTECGEADTSV